MLPRGRTHPRLDICIKLSQPNADPNLVGAGPNAAGVPRARAGVVTTALACTLALLAVPARADAAPPWQPIGDGSALNQSTSVAAVSVDIEMVGTAPHTAWTEGGDVFVRSWSGTAWSQVGTRVDGAGTSKDSRIESDGTRPWVVYVENVAGVDETHVRQWDGSAWAARGGALNNSGATNTQAPYIDVSGSTPYVVWRENSAPPRGYVKRWDGASWTALGGSLNVDDTRDIGTTGIAVDGTTPYVVMQQWNGTKWQVYVRRWDGTNWVTLGGSLNVNSGENAWQPRIALDGATPYVAWYEDAAGSRYVYVKRWNGTSWESVGTGSVNPYYANTVDLAVDAGTPYVTWGEWNYDTYVQVAARWTGTRWQQLGGGMNNVHTSAGSTGAITLNAGEPWVVWTEDVASVRNAFAKRYAPNNSMVGQLTNVTVSTSPSQVELSWTNPPDATYAGVRIHRSTTQGVLGSLIGTITAGATPDNAFVDTAVTAATTYYYHLVAYDSLGNQREVAYETGESFWSPRRYGVGVATDGSRLWSFGGCANCTVTSDIDTYTASTDTVAKQAAVLPSARYRTRASWVGGSVNKAFVVGGWAGSGFLDDIITYDPATGTVADIGNMPGPRLEGGLAYASNTDRLYYFGGESAGGGVVADTIFEIDPHTGASVDTGVRLAQPLRRIHPVYWPRDGCIYIFGGSTSSDVRVDTIQRFCPATSTITTLPTKFPAGRTELTATRGADEIYLIGGDDGAYSRDVWGFSPEAGTLLRHAVTLPIRQVTNSPEQMTGPSIYAVGPYPMSDKVLQITPGTLVRGHTTQIPATPTNTSPTNAQLVASGAVPLAASAYSDPDGDVHAASQWQVRTNAGTYASPLWDSGVTTTSLTNATTASIAGDGTYWFRVRYRDVNFGWSPWSAETSFSINEQAPNATPSSPADGAWVTSSQPLLEAMYTDQQADPGTITFEVCSSAAAEPWSTTCGPSYQSGSSLPNIASGATGGWAPATALAEGTWYWRVRGNDGIDGPWSAARSLRIDSVAPPTVTGVSATRSGLGKITITWNPVTDPAPGSGSITYDVETSLDGTTWSSSCTDTTATSCTRSGLGGQTLLHVRVRACDLAGNCSPWASDNASTGAGYYLRSTATTLLGIPNKLASLPPAAAANTATSIRHHNRTGWHVFEPGTTNSATPATASEPADAPHASPTGAGWVIDDYAGKVAAAGAIDVGITTTSNSGGGVGTLQCRAYRIATSGGSISSFTFLEKAVVAGDAVDGLASIQRTCSLTGLTTQTAFAANEALYVELWLNVTTAGPAGSTMTLTVDDGSSYVLAPAPGTPPDVPTLVSPSSAAIVSTTPALSASYTHPAVRDGVVEFEVATDSAFTSIVATGTSNTVASGSGASWTTAPLTEGTTYYWRARAVDIDELTSGWSEARSLTVTTPPAIPVASAPVAGVSTGTLTPELSASAFSDVDAGDAHAASEWQVRIATGSYATPAAASGTTTTALTSWTVPAGALAADATYAWRVRYRDSHGAWSAWSSEATFVATSSASTITIGLDSTTRSLGTLTPGVDMAATTTVSIDTTNASGYSLTATDPSDTTSLVRTSGGTFEDWTGTGASPTTWTEGTTGASGYFGATVVGTGGGAVPKLAKWGTGTTATDYVANRYAGLIATTAALLHERSTATSSTATITIGWRGNPATTTPAGDYSTTVTLSAVANP